MRKEQQQQHHLCDLLFFFFIRVLRPVKRGGGGGLIALLSVSMHRHRVVYRKANFYLYATSTTTRGSGANRRARSLARVRTSHQYDDTPEESEKTTTIRTQQQKF